MGSGMVDTAKEIYKISKALLTEKQKYPGEKHALQRTKEGEYKFGNYIGPGTNLKQRIRDDDIPLSMSDTVAQAHDLRYALSDNYDDARVADEKMISKLQDMKAKKQDDDFNIRQGLYGIDGKVVLEDKLRIPRNTFTNIGLTGETEDDVRLYRQKLQTLEQRGFGREIENRKQLLDRHPYEEEKPTKPGQKLLRKIVKQTKTEKSKKNRVPKSVKKMVIEGNRLDNMFKQGEIPTNIRSVIDNLQFE